MTSTLSQRSEPGVFSAGIITLTAMALILWVDKAFQDVTSAPVFAIGVFFLLAIFYKPKIVFWCCLPLWAFVSWRLYVMFTATPGQEADVARLWIRLTTIGIGGCLAIVASAYRSKLDSVRFQLIKILEAIPLPLLIADSAGRIIAASSATYSFSGLSKENVIGFRMPEVLGSHLLEEADENWYHHWLQSPEGMVFDAELQIGSRRSNAKVGRLGSGRYAMMIVIFL